MAKKFLSNIDLVTNELLNAVIQNLATDPSSGNRDGRIYYNTASDKLRVYANGSWEDLGTGAAGTISSVNGTAGEIETSTNTGSVTVGLPADVTISNDLGVGGDLTVTGDLTVNGTTTTLNTTELLVEDNIITLNSGVTGTPSLNAGIEVERGTSANVNIRWNETSDTWEATRDGSTWFALVLAGDDVATSDITNFTEDVQDVVGGLLSGSDSVSVVYTDATPSLAIDTTLAATSYLTKTGGLAVDKASIEAAFVSDGFTKKYAASIGNGTNTSFTITHGLGSADVQVSLYDNATKEQVEADVVIGDGVGADLTTKVTVSFIAIPTSNQYRAVIVG